MPTRLFLSGANRKSFKSKNSVGRKCCQLKVLKVLLMHLFVMLLINKTTGNDNRHFFFNTLEKEIKEEFSRYSTFCTVEQIENKILRKRLFRDALSKVHLNKYGSYFKFILLLPGDINLNPGPTATQKIIYYGNFSLSASEVFLLSGWIITLILYLQLAMTHGTYFKKEECTSFL